MNEQEKKLRVFLCHASENKPVVSELCDRLKADGFDPWLDSERLLPGMDWDLEIQQAMRASDAVIVCLSTISVKKEGYVQKEIKYAREIQKEKPDGTIFLIPVQLENCTIPFSLQNVQWGKYFEVGGYEKITKALNVRAAQLGRVTTGENLNQPHGLPPGSYLPFPRNALFTGREENLQSLVSNLLTAKPTNTLISQAITGRAASARPSSPSNSPIATAPTSAASTGSTCVIPPSSKPRSPKTAKTCCSNPGPTNCPRK